MPRHLGAVLLLMLTACGASSGVQPAAPSVAPAVTLRAIPAAHGLRVGERRTVRTVVEDGSEVIAAVSAQGKIDHPTVATFENGMVVGVARGTTTLHLSDSGRAIDVPIVVTDAEPVSLSIDLPAGSPRLGERIDVRAALRYADGTVGDATLDAEWSTATAVRLVVPNTPATRGAVVAIMPKPATLVARASGLEARAEIAPDFGEPSGIHVRLAWAHGDHRRFGAFAHWSDGATREVSAGCLWRVPGAPPFRGIERAQPGPWLPTTALSWDRIATCELGSTRASGTLFSE